MEYITHPYVDIGIATITAFVNKQHPSQLQPSDLERVVEYVTREYVQQPLRSFLTVVFPNSGFTQPAFFSQPERQLDYAKRVLQSYRSEVPLLNERCVFTGQPAVAIPFGDKEGLAPGRAFRQHIPLLTGEDVMNFFPYGDSGLPVSGEALLAIQVFPLGCAKSAGRLLAVHSDNTRITFHFARTFLAENRRLVQLAQMAGSNKMPESHLKHRTLLIETLMLADEMRHEASSDSEAFSVTAYHLSNSGQGPALDIYHLPMQTIGFLREMESAEYSAEWHAIVARAWERPSPNKKKSKKEEQPFQPSRNWLYEDLFQLPDNARRFVRTYFLRTALRQARNELDPTVDYSLQKDVGLVSWKITARFLRRIMNMEKTRIAQIRTMGDRLADYVSNQNDRRFFRQFYTLQHYGHLRTALVKANSAAVLGGQPPLVTLDSYIDVFEEGDEVARRDWQLARDLVLIRMVERLYELGWLGNNSDVIADSATEENNDSDSNQGE